MGHPRNSADRERFAALLIAGTPLTDAAREVGISRNTAQRWRHDPQVVEALEQYARDLRASVTQRLSGFLTMSLDRAEELLRDPDTPPQVLARLLGLALSESRLWIDTAEILDRLDRLELSHTDTADPLTEELAHYAT